MGYEVPGKLVGMFAAEVDMSNVGTFQYTAVQVATATQIIGHSFGNAAVKPIASGLFFGVLQNAPQQGEAAAVMVDGITKWKAAGNISVGALVSSNSSGQVKAAASGEKVLGIALEQAVAGDITTILLRPNGAAA